MARNISFFLKTRQVREGSATVTRRLGWRDLKPGTVLNAVVKARGLKRGERVEFIRRIRVVSVRREMLCKITRRDVALEGFPGMKKFEFVRFFCETHKGCTPTSEVTRIQFEYL